MQVNNLALSDYGNLANALAEGPEDEAVVSFDVVWSGPITRQVSVANGTLGDLYAGNYVENQATVTWSGTNLATGTSFTSNSLSLATSSFDGGFAELGQEQNGSFFSDSPGAAASVKTNSVLIQALTASRAAPAGTGATLGAPPQHATGLATVATGSSQAIQAAPGPVHSAAGAGHAPAMDHLFASLASSPFADVL